MTEKEIFNRIYPSVVTVAGDWRKMVAEVKELGLKEISLFVTGVEYAERQEIYAALKKTSVKKIPHVHLRNDTKEEEIDFLVKNFKSHVFTLHYAFINDFVNSKHKNQIFVENNNYGHGIEDINELKKLGGLCVDLSHLVLSETIEPQNYSDTMTAVDQYLVGCNHISDQVGDRKNLHYVKNLSDLDYLKSIPQKCFSQYINLELGNPIKEQLELKKYIAKILAKAWR
ncbi:MAG: hypothetical protein WCX71_04340 [Candidatus Buchananbacteria bacterium]